MLWILAILVVLLATPFVVGRLLSPEYGGRAERLLAAPPAAVFAALTDPDACPVSAAMCRGVARLPDEPGGNGLPAWTEDIGSSTLTVRVIALEPPRRLVLELADSVVPMKARWEIELVAESQGTRVELVHRGRIDDGTWHVPLFRFVVKVLGMADRGAREYLARVDERTAAAQR